MKHQRKRLSLLPRMSGLRLRSIAITIAVIQISLTVLVQYFIDANLAAEYRDILFSPLMLEEESSLSNSSVSAAAAAVVKKDYQDQQQQTAATVVTMPLPPPLLLLHNYMKQHSQAVLLQEEESANGDFSSHHHRRYILAYYSCPQQAGNRLHHLFNAFVWGIVLNRTVLVQYYTKDVCLLIGHGYGRDICNMANHQEDCDTVLHRHEWIPLYRDWKEKLRLPNLSQRRQQDSIWTVQEGEWNVTTAAPVTDAIIDLHHWSTRGPAKERHTPLSDPDPWKPEYERYLKIDVRLADVLVVDLPVVINQGARVFTRLGDQGLNALLATPEARERAHNLVALRCDFLYGMLFRHIFDFQPIAVSPKLPKTPDENVFLIALHSRHEHAGDNGSSIRGEIACIDKVLVRLQQERRLQRQQRQHKQHQQKPQKGDDYDATSCLLFVMSDRVETVRLLKVHARTRNCTALTAPKRSNSNGTSTTPSWRQEHGPFSGIGFFQDLNFVTSSMAPRTIQAFIGHDRSSSNLIEELIKYDRYKNTMMMMSEEQQHHGSNNNSSSSSSSNNNKWFTQKINCYFNAKRDLPARNAASERQSAASYMRRMDQN